MSEDVDFDKEKEASLSSKAAFSEQTEEAFRSSSNQWIGFVCFVDGDRLKEVSPEKPGFPLKAGVTTHNMPLSIAVEALFQMKQRIMSMYGLDDASISRILENEEPMQPVKL